MANKTRSGRLGGEGGGGLGGGGDREAEGVSLSVHAEKSVGRMDDGVGCCSVLASYASAVCSKHNFFVLCYFLFYFILIFDF